MLGAAHERPGASPAARRGSAIFLHRNSREPAFHRLDLAHPGQLCHLAPGQSNDDAFDRLDPLFRETGHQPRPDARHADVPQEEPGGLRTRWRFSTAASCGSRDGAAGSVLRYRPDQPSLLFCFLAPLLFLAFAGLSIGLGTIDKPTAAEVSEQKKKDEEEKEKRNAARPQNPIDTFLGAPAPEKPKTEAEKKKEEAKKKAEGEADEEDGEHSPTAAVRFCGNLRRSLRPAGGSSKAWLIKRLFRKRLLAAWPGSSRRVATAGNSALRDTFDIGPPAAQMLVMSCAPVRRARFGDEALDAGAVGQRHRADRQRRAARRRTKLPNAATSSS